MTGAGPPPAAARWPRLLAAAVSGLVGAPVLTSVRTTEPLVALTVDDGPDPDTTPDLLEVLAARSVRATFFVLGERVEDRPDLLARIAAAGHELGNHLVRDEPSVLLTGDAFDRDLRAVQDLLRPYGPVRWFRPGSGWFTPRMLRSAERLGLRCALGSPGLAVSRYPRPETLGAALAARCGAGDVVVLHEGTPDRAAVGRVAGALVDGLAARGLHVTTLSDLVDAASA